VLRTFAFVFVGLAIDCQRLIAASAVL